MTKFCLSAQDIHYKNKALVDDEIDSHTLCEELMLNDSFHLYISRDSSQNNSKFHPWNYFLTPYHTWLQNEYLQYMTLNTGEEKVFKDYVHD